MSGVTDPTEAYFKDGTWGWDGTQWRKLALVWGYSDHWSEGDTGAASGAGDAGIELSAVAAGCVHVLEALSVNHNAGANKALTCYVNVGGVYIRLFDETSWATGVWRCWTGRVLMAEGDQVGAIVYSPGDTKIVDLRATGYKMEITE